MKRESFIFYRSFMEALNELNDKQYAKVFRAITKYALNGEEIELSGIEKVIFSLIKPQLVANQKRYENGCKNKRNGSESEANKEQNISETEAKAKRTKSELRPNDNVNDNDNVNVLKESKNESKYIFKNNTTCARDKENLPTYSEIMEGMGVDEMVKPTLWEFIKHCQLNGKVLTNDKLESICVDLDKQAIDWHEQIKILKDAIRGGYFDIKRSG